MTTNNRISLREYFLTLAFPDGERFFSEPPEDEDEYKKWCKANQDEHDRRVADETVAWKEICRQAANGEITVEALHIENPDRAPWYPEYYHEWNCRKIIPREFFDGDIAIGPMHPTVIYYASHSPFGAPWADPVVILKQKAANAYNRALCVRWLVGLRRSGPPTKRKADYAAEALSRFGVSDGQFRGVWNDAAKQERDSHWGQAGAPRRNQTK